MVMVVTVMVVMRMGWPKNGDCAIFFHTQSGLHDRTSSLLRGIEFGEISISGSPRILRDLIGWNILARKRRQPQAAQRAL
jgi:hypothetical protein